LSNFFVVNFSRAMVLFIGLFIFFSVSSAQTTSREERKGVITFRSSQNYYVKFDDVTGIKQGDTIFIKRNDSLLPVIRVQFLSSRSCAGELITTETVKEGEEVFVFVPVVTEHQTSDTLSNQQSIIPKENIAESKSNVLVSPLNKPAHFSGRFSVQSYSTLSNEERRHNYQRWRYVVAFDGQHLAGGKISFSHYSTFSYRANEWAKTKSNIGGAVRVYDASLKYKLNSFTEIVAGRNINQKVSNISAIDGVQLKTGWSNYFAGAIIGARPNINDYGINLKLFETGGYVGRNDSMGNGAMENTFALFHQTNNFKTDRQFFYLQHSNSVVARTNIFFSTEVDMLQLKNSVPQQKLSLTNFYLLGRYSLSERLSLNASLDARRNVVYYETFKNTADSLFDRELRQGMKFSASYRLDDNIIVGGNYGLRFQKRDATPSRNTGTSLSFSSLPLVHLSSVLTFTSLRSTYIRGSDGNVHFTKSFFDGMATTAIGYRFTSYQFIQSSEKIIQHTLSSEISFRIASSYSLSLSYEGVLERENRSGRIFADFGMRF